MILGYIPHDLRAYLNSGLRDQGGVTRRFPFIIGIVFDDFSDERYLFVAAIVGPASSDRPA
jgi:hypothetical protein